MNFVYLYVVAYCFLRFAESFDVVSTYSYIFLSVGLTISFAYDMLVWAGVVKKND